MIEIVNPKTNLKKLVPVTGLEPKDISKMFTVYNSAGYEIKFKG